MRFRTIMVFPAIIAAILMVPAVGQVNVPAGIHHQGYVEVENAPFTGTGEFRFAIIDSSGVNLWTHDGSEVGTGNIPAAPRSLTVQDGLYNTVLGSMQPIPPSVFTNADIALRVWFDDGESGTQQLMPDQPLLNVPYARAAETAQIAESAESIPAVITVDEVNYSAPVTRHLNIPGLAFRGDGGGVDVLLSRLGGPADPAASFVAPVYLPDGATITQMTVHWDDRDNDSDLEVTLGRLTNEGALLSLLTVDDSVGTGDFSSTVAAGVAYEDLDFSEAALAVQITDTSDDWDLAFLNTVVIEYTVSQSP